MSLVVTQALQVEKKWHCAALQWNALKCNAMRWCDAMRVTSQGWWTNWKNEQFENKKIGKIQNLEKEGRTSQKIRKTKDKKFQTCERQVNSNCEPLHFGSVQINRYKYPYIYQIDHPVYIDEQLVYIPKYFIRQNWFFFLHLLQL